MTTRGISAIGYKNLIARRGEAATEGARTALSVRCKSAGRNSRTKLSALLCALVANTLRPPRGSRREPAPISFPASLRGLTSAATKFSEEQEATEKTEEGCCHRISLFPLRGCWIWECRMVFMIG